MTQSETCIRTFVRRFFGRNLVVRRGEAMALGDIRDEQGLELLRLGEQADFELVTVGIPVLGPGADVLVADFDRVIGQFDKQIAKFA